MQEIIKRDGSKQQFNSEKLIDAVFKSYNAKGYEGLPIELIDSLKSLAYEIQESNKHWTVEEIQDSVEELIAMEGDFEVARAYILHRNTRRIIRESKKKISFGFSFDKEFVDLYESYASSEDKIKFLEIEGIAPDNLDIPLQSKKFFSSRLSDVSIDANANANSLDSKDPNTYHAEVTKGILKLEGNYLLWREINKEEGLNIANDALRRIWDGELYLNDFSGVGIQVPYCFSFSTSRLMTEGRTWGQLLSSKPKTARSFISQVVETALDITQTQMGALAIADLIINYAFYSKNENLTEKQIENDFQYFIHIMNNKFRVSGQSPFSNISLFDKHNLNAMFGEYVYPDFSKPDFEYISKLQDIFLKFFAAGDPITGQRYRFPVVTASIIFDPKNGYDLDMDFVKMVSEYTYDNGSVNIYASDDIGKVASCCRLINDFKLLAGGDSFGNGGTSIGSLRVCTVNLASYGIQADRSEEKFIEILDENLGVATIILNAQRRIVHKRAKDGFLRFVSNGYMNIDKHLFSTFGINAISEAALFVTGEEIHKSTESKEFAKKVLSHIKDYSFKMIDKFSLPYNVEQIPAESASPKNALKDQIKYSKEIQPFPLYSNQFVPLWSDIEIFDRIKIDGEFSKSLSGGGISHLNMSEPLSCPEDMTRIIKFAIESGNEHFAINYNFAICENEHSTVAGNNAKTCSVCGGKIVDSITRVIGYFTPVSSWNKTRREIEHGMRVFKKSI